MLIKKHKMKHTMQCYKNNNNHQVFQVYKVISLGYPICFSEHFSLNTIALILLRKPKD